MFYLPHSCRWVPLMAWCCFLLLVFFSHLTVLYFLMIHWRPSIFPLHQLAVQKFSPIFVGFSSARLLLTLLWREAVMATKDWKKDSKRSEIRPCQFLLDVHLAGRSVQLSSSRSQHSAVSIKICLFSCNLSLHRWYKNMKMTVTVNRYKFFQMHTKHLLGVHHYSGHLKDRQ